MTFPRIKMSLSAQILWSMALGALFGLFFGELTSTIAPIGHAFIMLLKMSILPFMSFSLIHAIGKLSLSNAKRLFSHACLFFLLLWTLTLSVIFSVATLFPEQDFPLYHSQPEAIEEGSSSLLELFIPHNPVHALANDIIPAVVLFSLLFGVALIELKRKGEFLHNIEIAISALVNITHMITRLSPIGVFALIASTVGTVPFDEFDKIRLYIMAYTLAALFLSVVLLPLAVSALTPVGAREFIRELRPAILLAFTTGNVLVSLPYVIEGVEKLNRKHQITGDDASSTVESMVPIAYNFPTVGNLLAILFILFLSAFYAHPFQFGELLKLIGLGIPVLFGAASSVINGVSFLIDELHLPSDGLSLFFETLPLTRNLQTICSTAGIATLTIWLSFSVNRALCLRPLKIFVRSLGAVITLAAGISAIHLMGHPNFSEEEPFSSLELQRTADATVWRNTNEVPPVEDRSIGVLERIQRNGVLRVGYNANNVPFAYFNKNDQLVGYDIAMAYHLADALDAKLEFVPFEYDKLEVDLNNDRFDIAMSAVSVTHDRLQQLGFTQPYRTTELGLVVLDHRRKEFADLNTLQKNSSIKICVLAGSSLKGIAQKHFPNMEIVELKSMDAFLEKEVGDALIWAKDEGTTWSLIHPNYTVVIPSPSLGNEHYAYAVKANSPQFLKFVNYWLTLAEKEGDTKQQERYWILGKPSAKKPHWSILRDILHWQ